MALLKEIWEIVIAIFMGETGTPNHPIQEERDPLEAKQTTIVNFCLAIKLHEGWYIGSHSYRNNNPGNCRFSSIGYLPIYEPVKKDPQGFAIFKDYYTGWLYLTNLVKYKIKQHPEQTIFQFFESYAPASDGNNTLAYAIAVAKKLGVGITFQMKNLS